MAVVVGIIDPKTTDAIGETDVVLTSPPDTFRTLYGTNEYE